MLPVKKIYIDSKKKTANSLSTSNFAVDIKESYTFPEDTIFVIDDIIIPYSWYLINDTNNKLYVQIIQLVPIPVWADFIVTLTNGDYTPLALAIEIAAQLNASISAAPPFLAVWTCVYAALTNQIFVGIGPGLSFKIYADSEIPAIFATTTPTTIYSINKILGNYNKSGSYNNANPFGSQSLDLDPVNYCFLKSPNLGNFMTCGPSGEATIIKKIPVNATRGSNILDYVRSGFDGLSCSKQTLRRLEFSITDEIGQDLDLNGRDISFSLIFSLHTKE